MAGVYSAEVEDELDGMGKLLKADAEVEAGTSDPAELESLETDIYKYFHNIFEDSKAQMQPKRQDWKRYIQRYRGRYVEVNEDSPLKDLNRAMVAKICDLFAARLMQMCIPDKDRLDFIELTPDEQAEFVVAADILEEYSKLAGIKVREDLRKCKFVTQFRRNLLDLLITGNMLGMPVYEQDIQYRFRKELNPEFDPSLPEEYNARWDKVNGQDVETLIPPTVELREAKRVQDAPAYRYLNPRRVFPSEQDRHNYADCQMVCIADTVLKPDLLEDEIETGGYLYANLDKIKRGSEDHIPEIEDDGAEYTGPNDQPKVANNDAAKKLRRITCMGRFDLNDFCYELDGKTHRYSPKTKEAFYKKFDVDPRKRVGWKTWVAELVDDQLVRIQPLPFYRDAIPILHFGLFAVPNQTTAEGAYDRAEKNETVFNALNRYGLELVLKMVRPMYGVVRQNIDPVYYQQCGGKIDYSPHKIIPLMPGTDVNKTIQTLEFNAAPLQAAASAMLQEERSMSEMTHFPNVKQGLQSGGNTATEVAAMSANADVMIDEIAQAIESDFLQPMVEWILELHHQYTDEPKIVNDKDDAGNRVMNVIPPEIWMRSYHVNMMGYRQTGNYAVKAQAFEKLVGLLERTGRANWDEILPEWTRILQIKFGKRFIAPPPPPPAPDVKESMSFPITPEVMAMLPPSVVGKILMQMGIQLDPMELQALGLNAENYNMIQALQATASPQDNRSQSGGGSEAGRNHHAPGEYTPSRGLGDDVGIQKSLSQHIGNPDGSRMAQAI